MSAYVPWAGWWPYRGRCSCGVEVTPASFRDELSRRHHGYTGLCQRCCDDLFFRASTCEPSRRFLLRRGVLSALLQRECGLEVGMLPFLFVAPEARVAYKARFLLRVGSALEPLDPWIELASLRPALDHHQVRLTEFPDLDAGRCGGSVRITCDRFPRQREDSC